MARRKDLTSVGSPSAAATLAEQQEQADARARQAYDLRMRGTSWWDIAEAVGVSEGHARMLVADRIAAAAELVSEHTRRQLLTMEVARLDSIMDSYWDIAKIDVRAAELVLKVIAARAKLLGLESLTAGPAAATTVVIAGTSEEYVRSLQLVVGNARELESGETR